jgi:predicted RNA-binding protein with PIN domain
LAKHLLVDGSNILHAWPELAALLRRDRDAARSRLAHSLASIHDSEEVRVSLVFDGRGGELVLERPAGLSTFTIAFTPTGMTADDLIEQWVGKSRVPSDCLVATDDRAERQTIEALGASGMSAADLASWVARAEQRMGARLGQARRATDRDWRSR